MFRTKSGTVMEWSKLKCQPWAFGVYTYVTNGMDSFQSMMKRDCDAKRGRLTPRSIAVLMSVKTSWKKSSVSRFFSSALLRVKPLLNPHARNRQFRSFVVQMGHHAPSRP